MRRVDTVRLTARSPALVRHGAVLLEDALRTASFPETGPGRVLLIRRLPVGVIRGHLPPSSLALTLERVVRELAISAVHAGDASAPHRDAVFFHDDAEPPLALAERLVRGEPVGAWFWPLAVPDFAPSRPRDEALRLTLSAALRSSAGPAAAVRLVEALHARGGLGVLLGVLRRSDGPALLQATGGIPPGPAPVLSQAAPGSAGWGLQRTALRATVKRWVETWGAEDARSVWLATVALVMERRGRLADSGLFERASRLATVLASGPGTPDPPEGTRQGEVTSLDGPGRAPSEPSTHGARSTSPPRELETGPASRGPKPTASRPALPESLASTGSEEVNGTPPSAVTRTPSPPTSGRGSEGTDTDSGPGEEPTAPLWPEVPLPTTLGGLLFLIPVLQRLGLPTLLEAHPSLIEADVPERLFGSIARRLGASEPDAMLSLFSAQALGALPGGLEYDVDLLLRGLRVAVRWWCLRRGGIGLRALVQRPARIMATRTHLDVLLDIRQADLRIRRLGLDVDPGWVPWLGRVVRFHYLYGEQ